MMFTSQIKVHFDEADPAGIAFSGGLFTKMHRCFEEFIAGWDERAYFLESPFAYPLRQVHMEFLSPLQALTSYPVRLWISELGEHHFKVSYEVGPQDKVCARLSSVHVCCQREPFKKAPLPEALVSHLKTYLIPG